MTAPTSHIVLTVSYTDETTTEPDVIAAAVVNSVSEVYPESLTPPVDADPVWVSPQAAACLSAPAMKFLLDGLIMHLESQDEEPTRDELWAFVETVQANADLTA